MLDDYDTTNSFIEYFEIFDIKANDNFDDIYLQIVKEIIKDDTYNCFNTVKKEINKILKNGLSGLNILDPRYVASINMRYCHYFDLTKEPRWYLLRIWRR